MSVVFVADDDDDMRSLLVTSLERDGYDVREASNGAELLDLLAHVTLLDKPDVIVTDVFMPKYTGLGILEAVRKAGWLTPIVVLTAHHDDRLRDDALRLGATSFIRKPFEMADLRVAILGAIHRDDG